MTTYYSFAQTRTRGSEEGCGRATGESGQSRAGPAPATGPTTHVKEANAGDVASSPQKVRQPLQLDEGENAQLPSSPSPVTSPRVTPKALSSHLTILLTHKSITENGGQYVHGVAFTPCYP